MEADLFFRSIIVSLMSPNSSLIEGSRSPPFEEDAAEAEDGGGDERGSEGRRPVLLWCAIAGVVARSGAAADMPSWLLFFPSSSLVELRYMFPARGLLWLLGKGPVWSQMCDGCWLCGRAERCLAGGLGQYYSARARGGEVGLGGARVRSWQWRQLGRRSGGFVRWSSERVEWLGRRLRGKRIAGLCWEATR